MLIGIASIIGALVLFFTWMVRHERRQSVIGKPGGWARFFAPNTWYSPLVASIGIPSFLLGLVLLAPLPISTDVGALVLYGLWAYREALLDRVTGLLEQ